MSSISPPVHGRAAQENIEMVARLETEFQERRTTTERVADAIANFAGSMRFVVIHFAWFLLWVLANCGRLPFVKPFDPYPFVLLALIVSCEGVILSTFVLMKQNRMMLRADQRAHLDLQINLLAEREITKILRMQHQICRKLECPASDDEDEVVELSQSTAVDHLARELRAQIPQE